MTGAVPAAGAAPLGFGSIRLSESRMVYVAQKTACGGFFLSTLTLCQDLLDWG